MDEQRRAIAAIWVRQRPQTRERLLLLQHVAQGLSSTRSIDPADRDEARDLAHKLTGSLGMFGFMDASAHARAVEETLDVEHLPQPERLQQHVDALVASLAAALAD